MAWSQKAAPPAPACEQEDKPGSYAATLRKDAKPNHVPEPEPWREDEAKDDRWGLDESEWWEQKKAEDKQKARMEKPVQVDKPRAVPIEQLETEVIEWDQPSIHSVDLRGVLMERQRRPIPITRTCILPSTDTSLPENKRRLFANLHRQLGDEIETAKKCGSWPLSVEDGVMEEAGVHFAKPAEFWEDMDRELFEPRIRDIVRLLITKKRELELT